MKRYFCTHLLKFLWLWVLNSSYRKSQVVIRNFQRWVQKYRFIFYWERHTGSFYHQRICETWCYSNLTIIYSYYRYGCWELEFKFPIGHLYRSIRLYKGGHHIYTSSCYCAGGLRKTRILGSDTTRLQFCQSGLAPKRLLQRWLIHHQESR